MSKIIPPLFDTKHPFHDLLKPYRYKVFYGGRGAGKSFVVCEAIIRICAETNITVLCTRSIMNSIADSIHKLLVQTIERLEIQHLFTVTNNSITSNTGSTIIFKGLQHGITNIKSTAGIKLCVVEEAADVNRDQWEVLIPTIREEGSEIWVLFNTANEKDATYQQFVVNPKPNSIVHKINYDLNPYLPDTLRQEMEYMKEKDYEKYLHIWEGYPLKISEAVIFKNKYIVKEFESNQDYQPYLFGVDFGFSNDPNCIVRTHIKDKVLYIEYAMGSVELSTNEFAELIKTIPMSTQYPIYADCSRPETIAGLRVHGLDVRPCKKWAGSIKDGLTYLLNFDSIVIHPRCTKVIEEFENYSWKKDRITQEILPIPEDKYNHFFDGIRYSLNEYITNKTNLGFWEELGKG